MQNHIVRLRITNQIPSNIVFSFYTIHTEPYRQPTCIRYSLSEKPMHCWSKIWMWLSFVALINVIKSIRARWQFSARQPYARSISYEHSTDRHYQCPTMTSVHTWWHHDINALLHWYNYLDLSASYNSHSNTNMSTLKVINQFWGK